MQRVLLNAFDAFGLHYTQNNIAALIALLVGSHKNSARFLISLVIEAAFFARSSDRSDLVSHSDELFHVIGNKRSPRFTRVGLLTYQNFLHTFSFRFY